ERAHRGFERRRGLDRNDVATLGGENVLDVHGSPPSACSERAECRLDNARFAIEFRQPRHPAADEPPDPVRGAIRSAALDVDRWVALTKPRLSDGIRSPARCPPTVAGRARVPPRR